MEIESPTVLSKSPTTTPTKEIFHTSESSAVEIVESRKYIIQSIRSGSHTDIGLRRSNEDEHIRIDDLSSHLHRYTSPIISFYAVFDGHGGSEAATYLKQNAVRFFFEEDYQEKQEFDDETSFLEEIENRFRTTFLLVDKALADHEECGVDSTCGTTAITAIVILGVGGKRRHVIVANVGDCRAVMCRKGGVAVQMSKDHRASSSCPSEKKRVEDSGGFIDQYGYLNGELAVTRALGDWYMKLPYVSSSCPLIAEPEIQRFLLTDDDEFLIMGCDGIWDVMSNQEAVNVVRLGLREHDDPQRCARELVNRALRLDAGDNVTAVVVCFTDSNPSFASSSSQRPRFKWCNLSENASLFRTT